jgi:hypothetical protein
LLGALRERRGQRRPQDEVVGGWHTHGLLSAGQRVLGAGDLGRLSEQHEDERMAHVTTTMRRAVGYARVSRTLLEELDDSTRRRVAVGGLLRFEGAVGT